MMTQTLCGTFGKIYFYNALISTLHCVQNGFGHLNHPGSHLSWRKECIIKIFSNWRPFDLEMHVTGWYLKMSQSSKQWNQTSQGTILHALRENEGNSRIAWRIINELTSRKIHSSSVKEIKMDNSSISDPQELSSSFNNHFSQYWSETYQCHPTEWRHSILSRLS